MLTRGEMLLLEEVTIKDIGYVLDESRLVFVDCWAPWCDPCKALEPKLIELDRKYNDNPDISFVKINVQEFLQFSTKHEVYSLPCVLVFLDGEPAEFEDPSGSNKKVNRLYRNRPIEHYESVIEQIFPQ
jgi:thiol-disulfide isomerase/thioredoxin